MSKIKKTIFRILLLLLPLLILFLLEGFLRLFNLFPMQPLFLKTTSEGRKICQLNPDVGQRYFDAKQVAVPNLYPETFVEEKSAEIFRIFCLGESSTAGFPFEFQVPFPAQLRLILERQYPDRTFEVINLGMSAISSYSVLDFVPEVLAKQPDLIILYMGHNEFYGAYGSASAVSLGQNGNVIRLYLRLQKCHITQMVRALLSALKPVSHQNPANTTLMEQVIADKEVLYQSAKYRATLRNFSDNLSAIVAACQRKEIPVILGTLVANDADLPPLGSTLPEARDDAAKRQAAVLSARVDSLLNAGAFFPAKIAALNFLKKDSSSAMRWYQLGQASLRLQEFPEAKKYFAMARDRDVVRFRASDEVNRIIRDLASTRRVALCDFATIFEQASPHGIIGKELICDHLHPNPVGYYLMAKSLAQEISRCAWPGPDPAPFEPPAVPLFVTDLDWDMGLLRIYKLLHRWPFAEQQVDYSRYMPHGEAQAAQIAYEYVFQHHNWVQAHYALADHFLAHRQPERARAQYLAINACYPQRPEPLQKIAATYEQQSQWPEAERYYTAAVARSAQKGTLYFRLAMAQWHQKKMAAAVNTLQMAIVSPDLDAAQRRSAKQELAGCFLALGRVEYARRVVEDILGEYPDDPPAREMLHKLQLQPK